MILDMHMMDNTGGNKLVKTSTEYPHIEIIANDQILEIKIMINDMIMLFHDLNIKYNARTTISIETKR